MKVTRRSFLKCCGMSFAALGISGNVLALVERRLARAGKPMVVWLHGSSCTGCSVSLLNRIAEAAPYSVTDLLTDTVDLVYHQTVMTQAGAPAASVLTRAYRDGGYVLVVEGGIPTAFGGNACIAYTLNGEEVTFMKAVSDLSSRAAAVVCVGTCSSFGGIPAAGVNPTNVLGVSALTGRPTINISGCPANPDWVVWAVAQLIAGASVDLDSDGRPTALYNRDLGGSACPELIHDKCPRNIAVNPNAPPQATSFGQDGRCLINLGCRGPATKARCERCWNGIAGQGTWCIGVNAQCHGCVDKTFPGPHSFFEPYPL